MTPELQSTTPRWIRRLGLSQRTISLLALGLAVAITVLGVLLRNHLPGVETIGYPAVFVVSIVGNATLIFPLPAIVIVCTGGVLLNPALVALIAGAGQAMGEMTGYLAGYGGQGFLNKGPMYRRIQPWVKRRGWLIVVAFAIVPNPLFDVVGLAAGALRMPLWQYLAAAVAGKTARSFLVAYGCAYGYDFLRPFIESPV